MAKDNLERQNRPTVDSKSIRFLRFGASSWPNSCVSKIHNRVESKASNGSRIPLNIVNWIVLTENQWFEWTIFPGHTSFQVLREIQKTMKEENIEPEQFTDRIILMSMYHMVWGCEENKFIGIANSVRIAHIQARRKVEFGCRPHDVEFQRKRTSCIPRSKCVGPRIFEKQRRWEIVYTLLRWFRNGWVDVSLHHVCQSAQKKRNSSGLVWRTHSADFKLFFGEYRETGREGQVRVTDGTKGCVKSTNTLLTDELVRGNLLHEYKQKFGKFPDEIRVIKTCSEARFMKRLSGTVLRDFPRRGNGKTWMSWDLPRIHVTSRWWHVATERMDSRKHENWFGNGRHSNLHHGRNGIEIRIDSVLDDGSQSWIVISSGMNKYVTEMPKRKSRIFQPRRRTWNFYRETCCYNTEIKTFSFNLRKWIDINPEGTSDNESFKVAKMMTRLLRHGALLLEEDVAVEWKILTPLFYRDFVSAPHWSFRMWLHHLKKGGSDKNRFQYCLNPDLSESFSCIRAMQGHSGGNRVGPAVARQPDHTERLRRVHLPRWLPSRHALHPPFGIGRRRKRYKERAGKHYSLQP